MRSTVVKFALRKLEEHGVSLEGRVIDVGGAPRVCLDGKGGQRNPLLDHNPDITFLDAGFLGGADVEVDFTDYERIKPLGSVFDLALSFDTLEHVKYIFPFCEHLVYVAKPGGHVYLSTVFGFPPHPSPRDLFRFTPDGLRALFEDLPIRELWCGWEPVHKGKSGVSILVEVLR